ncbi:ABC transporter permease [Salisaeta longa]|uniref:ABC transporter permease n=1 Tax=Salisaeta longa TaxID=503170 RepID=UPI0003B5ADF6|nr:ABC transporter permease [Salisaeta longa]
MQKIWLILRSEFWRRVRSKAFVLATLLVPVGFVVLMAAPGLITYFTVSGDTATVAVLDRGPDAIGDSLVARSDDGLRFTRVQPPADSARAAVRSGTYDALLIVPDSLLTGAAAPQLLSSDGSGLATTENIIGTLEDIVQDVRLQRANASPAVMAALSADLDVTTRTLTESGSTEDHSFFFMAVGYLLSFVIYFAVFMYGQFVMQGVIEEKSSRVVEVVVSSVRPFELLMGKVLGIGAMGLTQMILWGAVGFASVTYAGTLMTLFMNPSDVGLQAGASQQQMLEAANLSLPTLPADLFVWFVLFFLGGYLLYASLFAAVGSAVEQQQDAQNLLLVVMLPLIVPLMMIGVLINDPSSTLAVVMSMVPFFSPILMILRVALVDVPLWQVSGAFVLLMLTFLGAVWVAGRIYRVGIFMYGKKASFKELARWITYSA